MALRDFALNNFRWKLTALFLATAVWFVIQFARAKGVRPSNHPLTDSGSYTFYRRTVLVLKDPGDSQVYKVTPTRVEIMVRSPASVLNKLAEDDIRAFVNVVDMRETVKETRPVFIYAPDRLQASEIRVEPSTVAVERLTQPK